MLKSKVSNAANVFTFILLCFCSAISFAGDGIDVSVYSDDHCDSHINVQLINNTDNDFDIDPGDLPWDNGVSGMLMFLYDWDENKVEDKKNPILSSRVLSETPVKIKPHSTLNEKIFFEDVFPNYKKIIKEKNVSLNWKYVYHNFEGDKTFIKVGAVYLANCKAYKGAKPRKSE